MKNKIVLISDTHRGYEDLIIPPADILIFCGDEDLDGEQSCLKFNDWLGKQPVSKIVMTVGNHDFYAQEEPKHFRELMSNATVLIDEEVTVNELRIYGSPWTPTFFDWAFMKPDLNLEKEWDKIPENLDILITHGPPFSILDKNVTGYPCGSQTLYMKLTKMNNPPKYHIFGHIHEARGEKVTESTTFINAACCPVWTSNGYKVFEPIVLEI
jgi:Icc-related predicted phosphoesterase